MKWWKWLVLVLSVVIGAAIIGSCMLCVQEVVEVTEKHELTIVEHEMVLEKWGVPLVTGTARNDKEFPIDKITIEIKWYSTRGKVLGSSSDSLDTALEPGEVWEFEVRGYGLDGEQLGDYKIAITGYRKYED